MHTDLVPWLSQSDLPGPATYGYASSMDDVSMNSERAPAYSCAERLGPLGQAPDKLKVPRDPGPGPEYVSHLDAGPLPFPLPLPLPLLHLLHLLLLLLPLPAASAASAASSASSSVSSSTRTAYTRRAQPARPPALSFSL